MGNKFEQDLTVGSVSRQLIRFSLPFLLSNFIQALYNVADMLIVGWFYGSSGISGVSIGGQVTLLVTNLVVGLAVGGSVLIAQYLGAKQEKDMEETIGTIFTVLLLAAVVITAVVIPLTDPILRLIQTPEDSFSQAYRYVVICMSGTLFIFVYNAISAILRGMGDSKRPLYFVAVAAGSNVLLDLLFVGAFGMGAAGAATATVIAQGISVVLSVAYLYRARFVFDFRPKSFRIRKDKLRKLMKIGLPTSVQNVIVNLSFLIMTSIVNGFGVNASAAVGVVGKFNGFAILPAMAMQLSVSSMAGQNIGAGLYDRARKTMRTAIWISLGMGVVIFTFVQLFPEAVMRLFTDSEPVIQNGVAYIRTFSLDYVIVAFIFSINGLINGSGHTLFALFSSMVSSILLRVPAAYLFGTALGMGLQGVGLAAPTATFGALIIGFCYYKSNRWKIPRIRLKEIE